MSQENVEIVRSYFQARNETRREPFDLFARNVVWKTRSDLPDTQSYRGHDGVQALFERFRDVLQDMWFEPEDVIPTGERVVVPLRWGGWGKGSGLAVEEREAWVFTVRDGLVVRVEEYGSIRTALEAAGLSE
jgi:ketosteroid isomerase-like protein